MLTISAFKRCVGSSSPNILPCSRSYVPTVPSNTGVSRSVTSIRTLPPMLMVSFRAPPAVIIKEPRNPEASPEGRVARVGHRHDLLGQHPGARRLLAQLNKTACCRAVDNPTILDDHGNLVRSLQHGDVRSRIAVPNDDVSKPARRDHADFAIQTHEPGVTTGVCLDCLDRRHADLIDEQFRLLAVPSPMGERGGIAAVAAA